MNKIIAVGHQKNVGKDKFVKFCIDFIRPEIPKLRIERRGFADKLYDFLHEVYGWAGFKERTYYVQNPAAKNEMLLIGMTPRQLLIEIGTPVMRAFDNNIWINALLKTKDFNILFINDMRFPNEFDAVRNEGGILIKIERPGLPEPTDIVDTALNGHGNWDLIIRNDGDLNRLHALAETFCKEFILT